MDIPLRTEDHRVHLAAIVESSFDAIISKNLQGIITSWNHAAEQLYGYTAAEAINQSISIIIPPTKQGELEEILEKIKAGEVISSTETIRKHKTGRLIPVFITISPIKNAAGEIIGTSTIARDISSHKLMEGRFQKILEAVPDSILIINDDGKINFVNVQTEKLFGYGKNELIGQLVEVLIPEPYRSRHPQHRDDFFKNPHPRPMGIGMELFGQRKDGEIFPVEISLSPFETREGLVSLAAIRDITERRLAEEGFKKILEATPDAIVIINQDGTINFINAQTEKLFGYEKNELLGQVVEVLIPEPYRSRHPQHRNNFFGNPHPRPMGIGMELFGQRKNEEIFPVEISLSPLATKDGLVVLAAIRDITERKKIDTMKNEFISIVSHELRTPLTSIQGSLELIPIIDQNINEEARELIKTAKQNSERLTQLINDILDIEKIESGKVVLQLSVADINKLAAEAIALNEMYAERLGVKIKLLPYTKNVYAQVDTSRILQVFTNLISNAVKFSPANKEVIIHISQLDNWIRIKISDQGPGIAPEFRSHVFQKFAQADSSAARIYGGTGLGLSITKAIVEMHKGKIDFQTTNTGTTFYFDLPLFKTV